MEKNESEPLVQASLLGAPATSGAGDFSALESRGIYTGARLRQQRPEVYLQVQEMLRDGESPTAIERLLHVDHRTVEAVARQHSIPIQTAKKRMAERMRLTAERMLDQANDTRNAHDAKNFVIAAGIADQHWQLLAGEPTSRTEHTDGINIEDVNGWIHLAAGKAVANGAATSAATDSESVAGACGATVDVGDEVVCIPETAGNGGAAGGQKGGRGGLDAAGPGGTAPVVSGSGEISTNGPRD